MQAIFFKPNFIFESHFVWCDPKMCLKNDLEGTYTQIAMKEWSWGGRWEKAVGLAKTPKPRHMKRQGCLLEERTGILCRWHGSLLGMVFTENHHSLLPVQVCQDYLWCVICNTMEV